jgi:hypothetical protein
MRRKLVDFLQALWVVAGHCPGPIGAVVMLVKSLKSTNSLER